MNKYIYIIGTVCILFVVATLFIKLLPFLLAAGILIYLITKLKERINRNKKNNITRNQYNTTNNNEYNINNASDDYTNGKIIDVEDYEEVDNK